jgi:hypothetical protein
MYVPQTPQGAVNDSSEVISIYPWTEFSPSTLNQTPAVVIKENDIAGMRLGIAQQHISPTSLPNVETFSRAWAGSITIFVVSFKPALVRLLAWEVATLLEELGEPLRVQLGFHRMEVARIGTTKPIREFPQNYAAPITLEYTFIRHWQLVPGAPILQHIAVNPEIRH